MLPRKLLTHALARRVDQLAVDQTIGSGEVDELDRACGTLLDRSELFRMQSIWTDRQQLARHHLSNELRADRVQRAAFRGDYPAIGHAPEHKRPDAPRVARGVDAFARRHDEAKGTLESP